MGKDGLPHHITTSPALGDFKGDTAVRVIEKDHINDNFGGGVEKDVHCLMVEVKPLRGEIIKFIE